MSRLSCSFCCSKECIRTQLRNHFQNLRSPAIIANNASVFVKGLIKVSKENARKRQKLCVNSRHFPYRFSKLTKDLRRCIHALKAWNLVTLRLSIGIYERHFLRVFSNKSSADCHISRICLRGNATCKLKQPPWRQKLENLGSLPRQKQSQRLRFRRKNPESQKSRQLVPENQ